MFTLYTYCDIVITQKEQLSMAKINTNISIDKELKEATAERDSLMKEFEKYARELGI